MAAAAARHSIARRTATATASPMPTHRRSTRRPCIARRCTRLRTMAGPADRDTTPRRTAAGRTGSRRPALAEQGGDTSASVGEDLLQAGAGKADIGELAVGEARKLVDHGAAAG